MPQGGEHAALIESVVIELLLVQYEIAAKLMVRGKQLGSPPCGC
jgi:hypothetical protein